MEGQRRGRLGQITEGRTEKRKTGPDHGRKDREEEDWVRSRMEGQRRGRLGQITEGRTEKRKTGPDHGNVKDRTLLLGQNTINSGVLLLLFVVCLFAFVFLAFDVFGSCFRMLLFVSDVLGARGREVGVRGGE